MKHSHDTKIELVDISTDVETVIDKITESVITVIVVSTIAHIIKKHI